MGDASVVTWIQAPGLRTGRLYVWLIIMSPALLLVSGIVFVFVGIKYDEVGVATFGAGGVVASFILHRVAGRLEVGPVKADLVGDPLFARLIEMGLERGATTSKAVEIAIDATEDAVTPGETFDSELQRARREISEAHFRAAQRAAGDTATERVREALDLEPKIENTVKEVAAERGWQYRKDVTVDVGRRRTVADYAVETNYGLVVIEFAAIKRNPVALVQRTAQLEAAMRRLNAWRGILVVPDGGVHGTPEPDVMVVEVSKLRKALYDFPD